MFFEEFFADSAECSELRDYTEEGLHGLLHGAWSMEHGEKPRSGDRIVGRETWMMAWGMEHRAWGKAA